MDLTELTRRLDNLLRLGTIAEVDHAKALAKVQSGNILTDWLPWFTLRAGTTQTWSPPTQGEQCLVLAVSDEFSDWRAQMKKNFSFLKEMIVQNVDDPDEQMELLSMYQKSSANPSIRRLEMMTRLRGIEEWAEEAGHQALFLTLTAPSSFHAQHSQGGQNKKWSGASPRQTHAYLNTVWKQYRALLAKRKIPFYGMRVAEPHHDGTPHWHLLVYVKKEYIDEVSELLSL